MTDLTPEDIAAARQEGDLVALLLMSAGRTPSAPKQRTSSPEPGDEVTFLAGRGDVLGGQVGHESAPMSTIRA